jgi:hypothetical protein
MVERRVNGLAIVPTIALLLPMIRRNIMAQLDFTHEEIKVLLEILQSDQSDLRMEIANTDRKEFRDHLKETKEVIQAIIQKLERSLPAETMGQRS